MGLLGSEDWEKESYPSLQDFWALPISALFFPSLRFILDGLLFEKLARRIILGKGQGRWDVETHDARKKLSKFKESAWKFFYYLSAELLALSVIYGEPWLTDTRSFWVGPGDQIWPEQKIKFKLKVLYMYTAGFYVYSIFALVFWETKRADFGVSMSHHVATLALLVMSYIFRFARVGSVVLALHDVSDVFVEIAKVSKYSGWEMSASLAFLAFVLSWTVLRIIIYPFRILRSTSYEVLLTLDKEKHFVDGSIYYYVFNTLLFCLFVFNVYWWKLMVVMLVKQTHQRGQVGEDIRSDSEDEDEHDE